jgi:hypothetical protein
MKSVAKTPRGDCFGMKSSGDGSWNKSGPSANVGEKSRRRARNTWSSWRSLHGK